MAKKKNKRTKGKKKNRSLHAEITALFKTTKKRQLSYKQIVVAMKRSAGKQAVVSAINDLLENGTVTLAEKNKLVLTSNKRLSPKEFIGIIDVTQKGFGFLVVEKLPQDIYVHESNMGSALDGDQVRVQLFSKSRGRRTEGKVVEILERASNAFIGTLYERGGKWWLAPDKINIPVDVLIEDHKGFEMEKGLKVVVEVSEWHTDARSKAPSGKMVEILGEPGSVDVEMKSIILEHSFPLKFPKKVEAEAKAIPIEISEEEILRREDFRDILTITIDPIDARDFDDALSFKVIKKGLYEIGVHIADVTHYIQEDTALEKDAKKRATSVYLPDRVIPMLPENLSNGLCSLRPNEEKLAFSAVFTMDDEGNVKEEWFGRTVILSDRRFTYEEAQEVIEGRSDEYKEEILKMDSIAKKLKARRFEQGSISFESTEVRFTFDQSGMPAGVTVKERFDAHMLVEDFMLLANRRVAEFISSKTVRSEQVPGVYRVHDNPDEEKLHQFRMFATKFGYDLEFHDIKDVAKGLNQLLSEIKGKPEEDVLSKLAIRSMAKAYYTTENIGHYGLGFTHYSHFTSPIRRYPDMMTHRILARIINKQKPYGKSELEDDCRHSSVMERRAIDAERAGTRLMQVIYMEDKVDKEFDAIVSGIAEWGIFVEVIENYCEGLVRIDTLEGDIYSVNEHEYSVTGINTGDKILLGQEVRVKLTKVDIRKRQLDFKMIRE